MSLRVMKKDETQGILDGVYQNKKAKTFVESNISPFLDKIEVGESLFVSYDEWKPRSDIRYIIRQFYMKHAPKKSFTTKHVRHMDGWVIVRLE